LSAAAVVLLSGGLDSVTVLALARAQGRHVLALSFGYGQRHAIELGCAARQAAHFGAAAHEIVDLGHLGRLVAPASALIGGSELAVPKQAPAGAGIPITYVPARNTVFLAYALAWAEAQHAADIWIGVNALDYSGYPDCRPEFIDAFARTAALATRRGVEGRPIAIAAPLQHLRKHEIIALGLAHGVDYADTTSCYDPLDQQGRALACGRCDSCGLRREGFAAAGVADPTRYVS
jgi:7-cyano-7-deazaguanine synthase